MLPAILPIGAPTSHNETASYWQSSQKTWPPFCTDWAACNCWLWHVCTCLQVITRTEAHFLKNPNHTTMQIKRMPSCVCPNSDDESRLMPIINSRVLTWFIYLLSPNTDRYDFRKVLILEKFKVFEWEQWDRFVPEVAVNFTEPLVLSSKWKDNKQIPIAQKTVFVGETVFQHKKRKHIKKMHAYWSVLKWWEEIENIPLAPYCDNCFLIFCLAFICILKLLTAETLDNKVLNRVWESKLLGNDHLAEYEHLGFYSIMTALRVYWTPPKSVFPNILKAQYWYDIWIK